MIKLYRYFCLLFLFAISLACSEDNDSKPEQPTVSFKNLTVNTGTSYQTIAGFGGANQMWGTQFPNVSDMQKAFGTGDDELGLSIFRIRISSNQNEWALITEVAKQAQDRGAKILASPWSPPPGLKNNNSDIRGHLLPENYDDFAQYINDFVQFMADNDVNIDAISIQNEPDWEASYESCDYTPSQMRDFLVQEGTTITNSVQIAAPESLNFNQNFSNVLLNDADAEAQIDIVAGHIYGGGLAPYPLAEQKNKEIWMTEYLLNQNATSEWSTLSEPIIWEETLEMLTTMHQAMEYNWNAYIWWYLKRYYSFIGDGDQGTTSGEILKRGYAYSHFSKFIRPGYKRVAVNLGFSGAIMSSAYSGANETVIVLINPTENASGNLNIAIDGNTPDAATAYTTSLSSNRQEQQLTADNDALLINILPKSVTTIVIPN